LIDPLLII